jgi:hypothetical protein
MLYGLAFALAFIMGAGARSFTADQHDSCRRSPRAPSGVGILLAMGYRPIAIHPPPLSFMVGERSLGSA